MQRTVGSTINAARSHLRSQGEILLRGSATVVCLPPLSEGTLGITASLTGELRFERIPLPRTWVSHPSLSSPSKKHRAPSSVTSTPGRFGDKTHT